MSFPFETKIYLNFSNKDTDTRARDTGKTIADGTGGGGGAEKE